MPATAGPAGLAHRIRAGPRSGRRRRCRFDGDEHDFAATLSREPTLAEHLTEQTEPAGLTDPADRLIGQHLIGMVNEAGYLTGDAAGSGRHARHQRARMSSASSPSCRTSIRLASSRATSRNASPCSSRSATASIRPWRRSSPISKLLGKRDYRRAAQPLRGRPGRPQGHDRRAPGSSNPKPGHAFGSEPVQPVIAGRDRARPRPTAPGSSNSTARRCRGCWSTTSIWRASRNRRRARKTSSISVRMPGQCHLAGRRAWTSAPRPS